MAALLQICFARKKFEDMGGALWVVLQFDYLGECLLEAQPPGSAKPRCRVTRFYLFQGSQERQ